MCWVEGREDIRHGGGACPMQGTVGWETCTREVEVMEKELFRRRRLERFLGCFRCGLPQGLCNRWVAEDEDGGRFKMVQGGRCQHGGVLVRMLVGLTRRHGGAGLGMVATRKIKPREILVVERPVLIIPHGVEMSSAIIKRFGLLDRMSDDNKKAFEDLANARPDLGQAFGTILTNSITAILPTGTQDSPWKPWVSLSLVIARCNHR